MAKGRRTERRRSGTWSRLLVSVCLLTLVVSTVAVQAAAAHPDGYRVQPGDTLETIAERFGLSPRALMRANGVRHPRDLRVGQLLTLGPEVGLEGSRFAVDSEDELLSLSRAAGVSLRRVARANQLLRPTELPAGLALWLPDHAPAVALPTAGDPVLRRAPRVAAAVRQGLPLWELLVLNPQPGTLGQPLLVPVRAGEIAVAGAEGARPSIVERVAVSAQPVTRGDVAVVSVTTAEPVTCAFTYADMSEVCRDTEGSGTHWHALVAFSPMRAPEPVTVTLRLSPAEGETVTLPVVLHVTGGRFDYERLDLPSDRQALLDPTLSQAETAKIASLRPLRSPTRHWTYPFRQPVESAVTSYFGSRRSYGYGFTSYHAGTDFDGEVGMPVVAPAGGVVVLAESLVVRGNAIMIDHGWGVVTGYWHLSAIDVVVGQQVAAGERIGAVGNTGLSTGAHLHWELWVNGVAVNVLSWLDPDGPAAVLGPTP